MFQPFPVKIVLSLHGVRVRTGVSEHASDHFLCPGSKPLVRVEKKHPCMFAFLYRAVLLGTVALPVFKKNTVDESVRAARAFRDSNLIWLEEPTIPDDVAGHTRIVREGGVPIATGENLHTLHEFTQMISAGAVTFPEPDVTNCGGITIFMKVAHLAEAYNLPVTSHGAHDLTVHLLAALPNRSYLEVHGFGLDRYIERPIVIRDGVARAPDTPGHGVAFDWKALEKVRAGGMP